MIALWFVLAASGIAAYTDVTKRRIPNALVLAVLLGGLALRATSGWSSLLAGVAIFAALIAAGCLAFSWGIAGGGDVKFAAAAGAALGWPDAMPFLLYTMLAGGILAVAIALRKRTLRATAGNVASIAFSLLNRTRPALDAPAAVKMPYAVAIFAGAAATLAANASALHLLRIAQ